MAAICVAQDALHSCCGIAINIDSLASWQLVRCTADGLYSWLLVRCTAGKAPDRLAATGTLLDTHVGFKVK